jgi:LPXTG-site transpeptidase (sortase) family protein
MGDGLNEGSTYKYEVYEIKIVKAEDVQVLSSKKGGKVITLVTCDYSMRPTGRLIVKGELIE